jgi:small subunit ribosomal protein S3
LGIVTDWSSKWFAEKEYSQFLHEDIKIQNFIKDRLMRAGISRVEIERYADKRVVYIYTARPGIVIGRRGGEVDKLKDDLEDLIGHEVRINIEEVTRPELDAQLVSESLSVQLERRVHFRRAMKKAIASAIRAGAEGIKIKCSGRIGGAEMARREQEKEGRIPLHTLRADIDYGFAEALTTAGKIGIKTWIFKGEKLAPSEELVAARVGDGESTGRSPRGGADRAGSEGRGSDRGGTDRGRSDRGRSDRGRSDRGRSDSGRSDRGRSDRGRPTRRSGSGGSGRTTNR